MNEKKPKILVYKVLPDEFASVAQYYENQFEVIDESTCFTDILAIPALMVILNPDALTQEEYSLLNEVFQGDDETLIVFTANPKNESPIEYSYFVDDTLAYLSNEPPMADVPLQLTIEYPETV